MPKPVSFYSGAIPAHLLIPFALLLATACSTAPPPAAPPPGEVT
jgi:hypothetical protein